MISKFRKLDEVEQSWIVTFSKKKTNETTIGAFMLNLLPKNNAMCAGHSFIEGLKINEISNVVQNKKHMYAAKQLRSIDPWRFLNSGVTV